jgi:hypothetical protein
MDDPYNQPPSSNFNPLYRLLSPVTMSICIVAVLGIVTVEKVRAISLHRAYLKIRYRHPHAFDFRKTEIGIRPSGTVPNFAWEVRTTPRLMEGDRLILRDGEFIAYQVDVVGSPADMVFCQLLRA